MTIYRPLALLLLVLVPFAVAVAMIATELLSAAPLDVPSPKVPIA